MVKIRLMEDEFVFLRQCVRGLTHVVTRGKRPRWTLCPSAKCGIRISVLNMSIGTLSISTGGVMAH